MERVIPEELTDGMVTIRRLRVEDADDLFDAARSSQPQLYPWMPWCHAEYALQESHDFLAMQEEHWNNGRAHDFAIVDASSGRYLGGVGLNHISRLNRLANLGYWLRTDATGRGAATRATLLAARFGFEYLELNRIEILASVHNHASLRVAERAGAKREGVLRRRIMVDGQPHDAVLFSLVREEILGE